MRVRGGVRVGGTGWRGVTGAGERRADLTRRGGGGLLGVPRVREPTLPGARREPRCVEWGRLVVVRKSDGTLFLIPQSKLRADSLCSAIIMNKYSLT